MNNLSYFSNKSIMITGAASGMGRIMTEKLVRLKCQLILVDVQENEFIKGLKNSTKVKAKVSFYKTDLASQLEVQTLCLDIQSEHPNLDILINNAGIVVGKSVQDMNFEETQKTFQVNTLAPIYFMQFFIKGMLKRKTGHIFNMSSASAFTGVPKLSDYAASKAALSTFHESLRLEIKLSKIPIYTTIMTPFYINTGMFLGVKTRFPSLLPIKDPEVIVNRILRAISRKEERVITPWFIYTVFITKLLPTALYDRILDFFGINHSMDQFTGRK